MSMLEAVSLHSTYTSSSGARGGERGRAGIGLDWVVVKSFDCNCFFFLVSFLYIEYKNNYHSTGRAVGASFEAIPFFPCKMNLLF